MKKNVVGLLVCVGLTIGACGSTTAAKYCEKKAACDGTTQKSCEDTAAYTSLPDNCKDSADQYYRCMTELGSCDSNRQYVAPPGKCVTEYNALYACKNSSTPVADAGSDSAK